MNANATIANNSAGTQVNRYLDSLGLPDGLGDALGAIIDTQTGNRPGAQRNLIDLNSDLSTRQMDSIFGGPSRPSFDRAFAARRDPLGAHLNHFGPTYTQREQVGERARAGQQYNFHVGPFHATGRITGEQYAGSFAKPIRLADGDYLFQGRKYDNLAAISKDARDGRIDGFATTGRTHRGSGPRIPTPGPGGIPNPFGAITNSIQDLMGRIFDTIGANNPGHTDGTGNNGATGGTGGTGNTGSSGNTNGTDNTASFMNDPNMSLEDKLTLLMSKLSEHFDKQISDKMKAIDAQMTQDKKGGTGRTGGAATSQSGGGLFSGIGQFFGNVGRVFGTGAGTVFGGPIGGMLGSDIGRSLGRTIGGFFGGGGGTSSSASASSNGGSTGTGGANGNSPGDSSNLQLLQSQLQRLLEKRQQMFQTMSNVFKSLPDTSMNTIRQMKA